MKLYACLDMEDMEGAIAIANRMIDLYREQAPLEEASAEDGPGFAALSIATNISEELRHELCMRMCRKYELVSLEDWLDTPFSTTFKATPGDEELAAAIKKAMEDEWLVRMAGEELEERAAYIGMSHGAVRSLMLNRIQEDAMVGLQCLEKFQEILIGKPEKSLFTTEDLYESTILLTAANLEVIADNTYELGLLLNILRNFGKEKTITFLEQMRRVDPQKTFKIAAKLGDPDGSVRSDLKATLEKNDYYHDKTLCHYLDILTTFCGLQATEAFVEKCLTTFDPGDLVDIGYYLARYMTPEQLERLDNRIAENTAEYSGWLQFRDHIPYFEHRPKIITAEPSPPLALSVLAPKTDKHIYRRLTGRGTSSQNNNRIMAQYSYPHELAGKIMRHADPALLEAILPNFRAKDEKAELSRLEVLHIATQTGRLPDLATTSAAGLPDTIRNITAEPLIKIGLDQTYTAQVLRNAEAEGVDVIPLASWALQATKSTRLNDFMKDFFTQYAERGNLLAVKQATPHELVDKLSETARQIWFNGRSFTANVHGQQLEVRISHDLSAVYKIGSAPTVNCLHYGYGHNRHGLTDLLGPTVAVAEIKNPKRSVTTNAIVRLVQGEKGEVVTVVEPIYDSYTDYHLKKEATQLMVRLLLDHSVDMGVELAAVAGWGIPRRLTPFIAKMIDSDRSIHVTFIPGKSPFNYSDEGGVHTMARRTSARVISWAADRPNHTLVSADA